MIRRLNLKKYQKVRGMYQKKKYEIIEIDGEEIENDLILRKMFDKAIKLPSYCGPNMDSVHDCFYDEDWTKKRKFAVLVKNLECLEDYKGIVRIFRDIDIQSKRSNFIFEVTIFNEN